MSSRLLWVWWVGFLALSPIGQEPVSGQIGLQEVTSLSFEGNRRFSDDALASSILTRETECRSFILVPFCFGGADFSFDPYYLNERQLRLDHARVYLFYFLRGYREAAVDTLVDRSLDEEVQITFQIQEGEPIQVLDLGFQIDQELPDSSVLQNLPIRVGEPLSMIALDAARDTLETRLRNRGFAHVDVLRGYSISNETPYEAEVFFEIYPGALTRFGPITVDLTGVDGKEPTMTEAVVRRMLPFRTEDVYSEELQFAGQRNLYNLDLFRVVNFLPDTLPAVDSVLPITIQLEESQLHRVRTGGGLSTAECFNFEASWGSRSFFGGARRLQLTGRVSNVLASPLESTPLCGQTGQDEYGELTWSMSMDFTQPYFFSPRNSVSGSLFAERQSIADVFVRQTVGLSLGLDRTLGTASVLGFSYRPELSSLTAAEVFFCSAYLICEPEEIQVLQAANRLAPAGVSISQDRRNQVLSPTRGYSALVDLEHAGAWTGSEFRYTRLITEGTWHTQGRSRWVLGARIRGGWVSPDGFRGLGSASSEIVHPEKRLYAGGSNSVRGFAQNQLGPRVLYLENVNDLMRGGDVPCTPSQVADLSCDAAFLADEKFVQSPTGGTKLLEGSLELRFPLTGQLWEAATFLDFGQVWDEGQNAQFADLEVTPGMGVRYFSPIGPIRVDLGYRFGGGEELPVVTKKIELNPGGTPAFFSLDELVVLDTPVLWGEDLNPWSIRRFQLHLSIGQAF